MEERNPQLAAEIDNIDAEFQALLSGEARASPDRTDSPQRRARDGT